MVCHYRQRLSLTMGDVAVFGHTHVPLLERDEWTGTLVMNPGSPTSPRMSGPTMGRIVVDEDSAQVVSAQIVDLS